MFEAGQTLQQTPDRTLLLADGQPPAFCRLFRLYISFQNVSVEDDQPQPKFATVASSHVSQIRDEAGAIEPVKIAVAERRDLALDPCVLVCLLKRVGWLLDHVGHLTTSGHHRIVAHFNLESMRDQAGGMVRFSKKSFCKSAMMPISSDPLYSGKIKMDGAS